MGKAEAWTAGCLLDSPRPSSFRVQDKVFQRQSLTLFIISFQSSSWRHKKTESRTWRKGRIDDMKTKNHNPKTGTVEVLIKQFLLYALKSWSQQAWGFPAGLLGQYFSFFLSFTSCYLFCSRPFSPLCFLTSSTIPFQPSHSRQPAVLQSPIQVLDFYTSCQLNTRGAPLREPHGRNLLF